MSAQAFGNSVAQVAGVNIANAVLSTPQGQAATLATAALVVATLPAIAIGAAAVGVGCGIATLAKSICR